MAAHPFVLLIALLLCVGISRCIQCINGEFVAKYESPEGIIKYYCQRCVPGTYCPGDNKKYACPEHTYTSGYGQTSCESCKNPIPNKTACMLDDAQIDIRQIPYTSRPYGDSVKLSVKGSDHFVFESKYTQNIEKDYLPTFNIFQAPDQSGLVTAYFSNITGMPSESNHTLKITGVNITALISHPLTRNMLTYITLEFSKPITEINVGFYAQKTYKRVVPVGVTKYEQARRASLNIFTIPNVKIRSKITLSISTVPTTDNYLYWSSDKSIPYPNEYNYQYMVSYHDLREIRTITVEDQGNVTISFYTSIPMPREVYVKVGVDPL